MARQLLAGDESRSNRTLIEQAAEYIRQHYAEPLSLDSLLAQTPVSKSWFLRLFRQYMGTTPYNFLLSTRITRAKELLVLTDFSVCEIAHQVALVMRATSRPALPPWWAKAPSSTAKVQ